MGLGSLLHPRLGGVVHFAAMLLVCVGALLLTLPMSAFVYVVFFYCLLFAVIALLGLALQRRRTALVVCGVLTVLQLVVVFFPTTRPFVLTTIGWRPTPTPGKIVASLYTWPESEKWEKIFATNATPLLYLSLSELQPETEVQVLVNDKYLGSLLDIPGVHRKAGGYALPLDMQTLRASTHMTLEILFKNEPSPTFFTATQVGEHEFASVQKICPQGERCVDVSDFFESDIRYVIEVRITDDNGRTLGVLY